jgi:hypothetical protein
MFQSTLYSSRLIHGINVLISVFYSDRIKVRMNFVKLVQVGMTERVIELNKSGKENPDNSIN